MSLSSFNPQGPAEVFPGMFLVPGGGLAHYVHTSGAAGLDLLPAGMAAPAPASFSTNIDTALGYCRSNRGDVVMVLPGHTQNITADAFASLGTKTGVSVIGMGYGTNRPTLTWTAAGSTLLMDAAGFSLKNFNFNLAGAHAAGTALTVAAPITVSAASCEISDCFMFWGFDADQIVTVGVTVTGADYFKFNRNTAYAATAAVPTTTFLQIVDSDFMQMHETKIQGPGSTTTLGPVQFVTTASLAIDFRRSIIQNQLAASVHAITGMAGLTGTCHQCGFGILDNATAAGFVTPGNVQLIDCATSNDNGVGSAGPAA
jgi:hypothetical protein